MTTETATTRYSLSGDKQRRLSALLDTILPASEDGTMPSAAELNFLGYVQEQSDEFMPALVPILDHFDNDFPDQPLPVRFALVQAYSKSDAKSFDALLFHVYDCYYQDDQVRELVGTTPGAPFPRGNIVEPGDLSLLEVVLNHPRSYRT